MGLRPGDRQAAERRAAEHDVRGPTIDPADVGLWGANDQVREAVTVDVPRSGHAVPGLGAVLEPPQDESIPNALRTQ